VRITSPLHGPRVGLAMGTGVLELRLLHETKSNRTKVADFVIAYACALGLSLGLWVKRLRRLWPDGNRIEDTYYSMGTYRRGGRSSCTKRTNGTLQATPAEVYEHGRWTVKQSKENMPTRYNELTLDDCINLTLLCM
jgi:hypothetical protein